MMRQTSLSGIVRRRFVHCVNYHQMPVHELVTIIGLSPGEICKVVANQNIPELPLHTIFQIAQWLRMPLVNVVRLSEKQPEINELLRLGLIARGYNSTNTSDQFAAAEEIGISVAVFRRALHGYEDFRPSVRTCDKLAQWLAWTGFDGDDIAVAAGMLVRYMSNGSRITITPQTEQTIHPYACACGRAGCMVPAHIPNGPRRKWRSDACRMWVARRSKHETRRAATLVNRTVAPLPHRDRLVRFIMINERPVPVRF